MQELLFHPGVKTGRSRLPALPTLEGEPDEAEEGAALSSMLPCVHLEPPFLSCVPQRGPQCSLKRVQRSLTLCPKLCSVTPTCVTLLFCGLWG